MHSSESGAEAGRANYIVVARVLSLVVVAMLWYEQSSLRIIIL